MHRLTSAPRLILGVLLLLSAHLAAAQTSAPTNSRPPHDEAMLAAIAKAQASFDKFLALSSKPPKGSGNYMVKIEVTTGDRIRRVWVNEVQKTPEGFTGLAFAAIDDPEQELVANEQVVFRRGDITDWMYTRNNRQVGGYTICAALAKHPPAARREQMKMYRLDCK
ncbi:DUF2314 domain-containing protein [Viridibacterium curvum]|uniref:DUF2314 domain-containing protein n=1 Tax=Viridibacterium curvum TaxID=1101404 RepID=A0ABP9R7A7_9RHOO